MGFSYLYYSRLLYLYWNTRAIIHDFPGSGKVTMKDVGEIDLHHIRSKDKNARKHLLWHHNGRDGVSNHQPHECLLNRSFMRRSKKTSKLRATGLCVGNSPEIGEFPAQMASNAENVSIWWRHHEDEYMFGLTAVAFMHWFSTILSVQDGHYLRLA